jgi:hypothetical protein
MAGATVFTLPGFFGSQSSVAVMLGGQIAGPASGNTVVPVNYNNYSGITVNFIEAGAALLNTMLLASTATSMIAFGHSEGAVCISYWLQNYGPTSSITPATTIGGTGLSCIMLGNSVCPYGGALTATGPAMWDNWFPGATLTVSTSYATIDAGRQYDGWRDWPTGTMNFDAEINAFAGQGAVHPVYTGMSLTDPTAVTHTVGHVKYLWWPTIPVPIYGTTWNSWTSELDEAIRPTIEGAYSRPVTIPAPTYL